MARSRTLTEIVDEAYRYADVEGQLLRHPRADVVRWANKGLAELWDLLIAAHALDWGRSTATLTLTGATDYALPATFYQLLGARLTAGGALLPYPQHQDAELRDGLVQAQGATVHDQQAVTGVEVDGGQGVHGNKRPAAVHLVHLQTAAESPRIYMHPGIRSLGTRARIRPK